MTEHVADTDWQSHSRAIAGLPIGRKVHPGRTVIATLALLIVVFVLQGLVRNSNFQWPVVRPYFFAPSVLDGIRTTISLTVISMAIALVVAVVLANMGWRVTWSFEASRACMSGSSDPYLCWSC